ncbi:MAG TPA: hypothetical protein DC000_11830 [Clostridiales bacterium]|nr:hypothetical protein [Clostridiales bacterium]
MLTDFKDISDDVVYKTHSDPRYDFIYRIVNNDKCTTEYFELLQEGFYKEFKLNHYCEAQLIALMGIFKNPRLFEHWINVIIDNIFVTNFNVANRAIGILQSINKTLWLDEVSVDSKYRLVKTIIKEGCYGGYHSHDCEYLMNNLIKEYPELVRVFIECLVEFNESFINEEDIDTFLSSKYADIVISYIKNESDLIDGIVSNLNSLKSDNKTNESDSMFNLDNIISRIMG